MADHHQQHRPHRWGASFDFLPSIATAAVSSPSSTPHPPYPNFSPSPTPTPSKNRAHPLRLPPKPPSSSSKSSLSFLLLLFFSLRSLYTLLPGLRSPSFYIFPFCFLVSFLSFILSLSFSLFSPSTTPLHFRNLNQSSLSISSISVSQHRLLLFKSVLLGAVFLLRFLSLRYCGAAAMILAELSGNVAARFFSEAKKRNLGPAPHGIDNGNSFPGVVALFTGLFLLSMSWDRIDCFPFSASFIDIHGFSFVPGEGCVRILPMLLPFLSGFMGFYERVSVNPVAIRQLGQKRVRLISLFYTTALLFFPSMASLIMYAGENDDVSIGMNFGWPLVNTVVFGVLLSENYSEDKLMYSKDFQREFIFTLACTIVLELFYFPELSLWGFCLCGLPLYFAVTKLDPGSSSYVPLGLELELESPEPFSVSIMKPIRHILSERKSRKIALFLLINTAYMVVEFVAGFMSNSLGLISDACHMLFDCAALAIGLYASYISRLPANSQFNYGRGRFEVLSGYVNAVLLVLVGALIVLESFERILDPKEISTNSLLTVSIGGLVVNIVGLIFFHEEHHYAHGGSCSHSHSHPHSHDHHHHDHDGHEKHHDHAHGGLCSHPYPDSHGQHHHADDGHEKHHDHAHGGSCSHSHPHPHSHDHHPHSHDHDGHDTHHECIPMAHDSHEKASSIHHDHTHPHDHHGHDHAHHHDDTHQLEHLESISKCSNEKEPQKREHRHVDHNMEGIFLHVLADTLGSVGVVISTLLIKYKGWVVADPACSIFISVLIVSSVVSLLGNSAEILLLRVPRSHEQEIKEAINAVTNIKGVCSIQSLHIWSLTNTDIVGTLRFYVLEETDKASTKARVIHLFNDAGVKDLTVQVECVKGPVL